MGHGHLFEENLFGAGFRLPFDFEIGAKLVKILFILPGRTVRAARKPCVSEFRLTTALPSRVRGPVDSCALRRFASSCFSETISHLLAQGYAGGGAE
jgi:hypothetical protein